MKEGLCNSGGCLLQWHEYQSAKVRAKVAAEFAMDYGLPELTALLSDKDRLNMILNLSESVRRVQVVAEFCWIHCLIATVHVFLPVSIIIHRLNS